MDIPVSMNPKLIQGWKPFGVPSTGRLYCTPIVWVLLRIVPDWTYSMSIWFDHVYPLIHLVVCVILIQTLLQHWRYEMLQPRPDIFWQIWNSSWPEYLTAMSLAYPNLTTSSSRVRNKTLWFASAFGGVQMSSSTDKPLDSSKSCALFCLVFL